VTTGRFRRWRCTGCWQRPQGRRKAAAKAPLHETAVSAAELGLRGTRKAEEAAESARLKLADVMAEARERVGEEVPPPSIGDAHQHDH
jgi:Protein of unknown function (DUF1490)